MPTRILRDGILDSRSVNLLSETGEILYRRLMSIVDDYGRFDADFELVRARCFPRQPDRWTPERVGEFLLELRQSFEIEDDGEVHRLPPLVTVYRRGIKKYLQINNFGQRVQAKAKYPGPEDEGSTIIPPESTVSHRESPSRATRARSESESEPKAESGVADPRNSTVELPVKQEPVSIQKRATRIQESVLPEDWCSWSMAEYGWTSQKCHSAFAKFRDHWLAKPGRDGTKLDWLATWRNWCRGDIDREAKGRFQPRKDNGSDAIVEMALNQVEGGLF